MATKILIDTSALFDILDSNGANHRAAKTFWFDLLEKEAQVFCTSYILLETLALIQKRLGMKAVRDFHQNMVPVLHVVWISEEDHNNAIEALLLSNRRRLSLVDCSSFVTMRRLGISMAFAFDPHFIEQGFEVLP
jgi:predicted nucleic acid-binding protein